MSIFKSIFNKSSGSDQEPQQRIRLTEKNIDQWPTYDKLLKDGKTKFDGQGRLRYLHGAPVGDLVLTKTDKQGKPIYNESVDEWFDPDSQKAKDFNWT